MNPDREPSRLPLRAGAMLLLAVAIVFVGLGWHSAATSGDDPEKGLEAAQRQVATTAAPSTSATASAVKARVCVYNAGTIAGLAGDITDELKAQGFETADPGNLSTSSITENTVFYDDDQKTQAEAVAEALGGASVDPRPSSFTRCSTGIPVIVVSR